MTIVELFEGTKHDEFVSYNTPNTLNNFANFMNVCLCFIYLLLKTFRCSGKNYSEYDYDNLETTTFD